MKPQFCMHLPFPLVVPLFTAGESRWSRLQSTFVQEALRLFLHNFTKAKLASWLATPGYEHPRKVIAYWYVHNQKCFRQVQVALSLTCGLWAFKVIRKMLSCVLGVLLVNFCIRYSWRYYFYLKNITPVVLFSQPFQYASDSSPGWPVPFLSRCNTSVVRFLKWSQERIYTSSWPAPRTTTSVAVKSPCLILQRLEVAAPHKRTVARLHDFQFFSFLHLLQKSGHMRPHNLHLKFPTVQLR